MVDADHPAEVFLDYDIKEAANAIGIDETQLGEDTADENMTLLSDKPASSVETGEARRRN